MLTRVEIEITAFSSETFSRYTIGTETNYFGGCLGGQTIEIFRPLKDSRWNWAIRCLTIPWLGGTSTMEILPDGDLFKLPVRLHISQVCQLQHGLIGRDWLEGCCWDIFFSKVAIRTQVELLRWSLSSWCDLYSGHYSFYPSSFIRYNTSYTLTIRLYEHCKYCPKYKTYSLTLTYSYIHT